MTLSVKVRMEHLTPSGLGASFLVMARTLRMSDSESSESTSQSGGLVRVVWMKERRLRFGVIEIESKYIVCSITSCRKVSSNN